MPTNDSKGAAPAPSYEATLGFQNGDSVVMERDGFRYIGKLGMLYTVDGRTAEQAQWCADVYVRGGGRMTCWFGKDTLTHEEA